MSSPTPSSARCTKGIGAAVVAHAVLAFARGRAGEALPFLWLCAVAFVVHFSVGGA